LYEHGLTSRNDIKKHIPGLKDVQADNLLQDLKNPNRFQALRERRAKVVTGDPAATAGNLETVRLEAKAREVMIADLLDRGTGRPVVALSTPQEAVARNWNRGDRFSYLAPDGRPAYFLVTRNRQGGETVYKTDFHSILLPG
jgi:hypothetical protein